MDAIYTTLGIPFGYVLRFIFEAVDNYGLALILFTLFARLLMIPTSIYQTKGTVNPQGTASRTAKGINTLSYKAHRII